MDSQKNSIEMIACSNATCIYMFMKLTITIRLKNRDKSLCRSVRATAERRLYGTHQPLTFFKRIDSFLAKCNGVVRFECMQTIALRWLHDLNWASSQPQYTSSSRYSSVTQSSVNATDNLLIAQINVERRTCITPCMLSMCACFCLIIKSNWRNGRMDGPSLWSEVTATNRADCERVFCRRRQSVKRLNSFERTMSWMFCSIYFRRRWRWFCY